MAPPSRDPLIIGGDTFPDWRPLANAEIQIQANPAQTANLLASLGKRVPGMLPDGEPVEFLIYTVQGLGERGSEVMAYVEVPTGELL